MKDNRNQFSIFWKAFQELSPEGVSLADPVDYFLQPDNISFLKFSANTKIFMLKTIQSYRERIKTSGERDMSRFVTPSIEAVANYSDQLVYPNWFIIAYPDVLLWFGALSLEERKRIVFKRQKSTFRNERLVSLRKIVDAYTKNLTLECSILNDSERSQIIEFLNQAVKETKQGKTTLSPKERIKQLNDKWAKKGILIKDEELVGSIQVIFRPQMQKSKCKLL